MTQDKNNNAFPDNEYYAFCVVCQKQFEISLEIYLRRLMGIDTGNHCPDCALDKGFIDDGRYG